MGLHDPDVLDRVFVLPVAGNEENGETLLGFGANGFDRVDGHLGELLGLRSQDLGAERGLEWTRRVGRYFRDVEQNRIGNLVTRNEKVFSDEADAFLEGETIATHNQRWMHGKSNQLQTVLKGMLVTGKLTFRSSAAKITTLVVPSPTSLS